MKLSHSGIVTDCKVLWAENYHLQVTSNDNNIKRGVGRTKAISELKFSSWQKILIKTCTLYKKIPDTTHKYFYRVLGHRSGGYIESYLLWYNAV
jgi:hypothetical protein